MSKTKTSISPPTISKPVLPIFFIIIKCNIIFRVTTFRKLAFNLLNTLFHTFIQSIKIFFRFSFSFMRIPLWIFIAIPGTRGFLILLLKIFFHYFISNIFMKCNYIFKAKQKITENSAIILNVCEAP